MAVLQVTVAVLLFLFVDDVAGQNSQNENLTYNICGNESVQVGGVFYLASPDFFNQPLDNDRSELCRGRNRREAAKDTPQHTERSNTQYATNMTADGYCEVDVNAGKPRIIVSPLPSTDKSDSTSGKYVNGNGKENGTDQHSTENNLAQGGSESVSGAKSLDDGSENTAYPHQDGPKKPAIYHILEPDPDAPQEPGLVIVPVQREKTAKTKDGIPTPGASSDPGEYIYLRNDDAEAGGGAEASGSSFGPRENSFHAYADVDESAVGEFSASASFSSRPSSLHNYAEIEDAAATPAGNPDPHGDPPANKHNARRRDYGQYEEIQIKPLGQGS
ncbi:hypothetical protein BaRGS_00011591 [Batillaria attramentaria]|uniref:Uncharacterized protein n=1 Tax=Batillaria attramentaria TaxID=370345 RepID=A0ABD0LCJ4_9CAEN